MNRHKIETKIMNPLMGSSIPLPAYATSGSAAMDLRACLSEPLTVQPGETVLIPSGIAISIHDPDLVALLVPRSGLGIKHGIVLANTVGVIDSDYQGEIGIGIYNRGKGGLHGRTGRTDLPDDVCTGDAGGALCCGGVQHGQRTRRRRVRSHGQDVTVAGSELQTVGGQPQAADLAHHLKVQAFSVE